MNDILMIALPAVTGLGLGALLGRWSCSERIDDLTSQIAAQARQLRDQGREIAEHRAREQRRQGQRVAASQSASAKAAAKRAAKA